MHEQLALFANTAFYQAFSDRDAAAMRAVWSSQQQIACLHPGWPALIGHEEVLGSWDRILSNPDSPTASCYGARALRYDTCVLVVCYERVGGMVGIATNSFAMEGESMKLVHHQGAPCSTPPPDVDEHNLPQ